LVGGGKFEIGAERGPLLGSRVGPKTIFENLKSGTGGGERGQILKEEEERGGDPWGVIFFLKLAGLGQGGGGDWSIIGRSR